MRTELRAPCEQQYRRASTQSPKRPKVLKVETQGELEVTLAGAAGAAALDQNFAKRGKVGRVQADVCGAAATARAAPVRVIPDVVGFRAELQSRAFCNLEGFEKAHVPVGEARLIDDVADTLGVKSPDGRSSENRRSVGVSGSEP